jgi:hypothetical protein
MTPREYFQAPRELRYSLLFAFPLLALYEGLSALLTQSAFAGVRNGADVLLKSLFVGLGGRAGLAVFGVLLLGVGAWLVWRDQRARGGKLDSQVFLGMLGESIVYAAVFGQVTAVLTATLLRGAPLAVAMQEPLGALPLGTQLVVSLGAGIYEELLFRVLLVSGLLWVFKRLKWRTWASVTAAVVLSALIFSGFHYIGPYGDPLAAPTFTFRAIAGLLLSGLYVARGFGVAAWTHALYDVGLALFSS